MSRFIIYRADTGKRVTEIPAVHALADRVIRQMEAGKHSAELMYDDLECHYCGTESGPLALQWNGMTKGYDVLCEPCHGGYPAENSL